jgi:hypothetical protein
VSSSADAARRVMAYAVVRFDPAGSDPQLSVTVKEIVPTRGEAEREVTRLAAAGPAGVVYFWQSTRLYPRGRLQT